VSAGGDNCHTGDVLLDHQVERLHGNVARFDAHNLMQIVSHLTNHLHSLGASQQLNMPPSKLHQLRLSENRHQMSLVVDDGYAMERRFSCHAFECCEEGVARADGVVGGTDSKGVLAYLVHQAFSKLIGTVKQSVNVGLTLQGSLVGELGDDELDNVCQIDEGIPLVLCFFATQGKT